MADTKDSATEKTVKESNTGKVIVTIFATIVATAVILLLTLGHSPTSEARQVQGPKLYLPPGATPVVHDEVVMPKEIHVTIGTEWYSPAPDKPFNIWGYAVPATPPNRTPIWQMQYTYLDNTKSEIFDIDSNKYGEFTWPEHNKPVKVTLYRIKPYQWVDQWEFDFHLDPFSTKS